MTLYTRMSQGSKHGTCNTWNYKQLNHMMIGSASDALGSEKLSSVIVSQLVLHGQHTRVRSASESQCAVH